MAFRIHHKTRDFLFDASRQRIEQRKRLDLVVEQLNANGQLRMLGRKHIDHVAAHPKTAARKISVIAAVLHADQPRNHIALAHLVANAGDETHLGVILGRANAVDGTHSRDDDGVAPLQHAFGRRQPHLLDVLIDGRVFFNEQIALRHIGFRLVVVVIADEILDRVFREKLAEFAVKLRGQCFVRRKHNRWPAQPRNHIGHGVGFARAGYAQQGLEHFTIVDAFHQLVDGLRLVARWQVRLKQLKG